MAAGLNAAFLHTRCFQLGIAAGVIAVTAVGQTPFLFPGLLRELFPDFLAFWLGSVLLYLCWGLSFFLELQPSVHLRL